MYVNFSYVVSLQTQKCLIIIFLSIFKNIVTLTNFYTKYKKQQLDINWVDKTHMPCYQVFLLSIIR